MPYVTYKSHDGEKPLKKLCIDIFLRMLAAGFMCAIIYVSMHSIFLAFGTHITGYTLQEKQADNTFKTVDEVLFDTPNQPLPEIENENMRIIPNEEMTPGSKKACNISSQVLMLLLFCVLLYTEIWSCGDSDRNLVKYGKATQDKYKGLKAGAIACIPMLIGVAAFSVYNLISAEIVFSSLYSFANVPFKPFIELVLGAAFNWYDALLLMLPALFVVLYCHIVYTIGYKQILVGEKILYTNK